MTEDDSIDAAKGGTGYAIIRPASQFAALCLSADTESQPGLYVTLSPISERDTIDLIESIS